MISIIVAQLESGSDDVVNVVSLLKGVCAFTVVVVLSGSSIPNITPFHFNKFFVPDVFSVVVVVVGVVVICCLMIKVQNKTNPKEEKPNHNDHGQNDKFKQIDGDDDVDDDGGDNDEVKN